MRHEMMKLPRLREQRRRRVLSQRELAALAATTQMTVYRLEAGHDARPATTRRLAKALKVRPADLMEPDRDDPSR